MLGPSLGFNSSVEEDAEHPLDAEIDKYLSLAENCFKDFIRDPDNFSANMFFDIAGELYDKRFEEARGHEKLHTRLSELSWALYDSYVKNRE